MFDSTVQSQTVSVIVPAYNGTATIGDTIQSVLAQTHPHFELIVVDDASTDDTAGVVKSFADPRLTYIRHTTNKGAHGAWLTGLEASRGAFVACLDQDDVYHPDKLLEHMRLHATKPEVGLSYNGRFEVSDEANAVRGIWQPATTLTLGDLVLGFPFAPSDMVIRREWALREDIWADNDSHEDGVTVVNGAEYVYCGRLWFAGCRFAGIPRALNGRRHIEGRRLRHLAARCHAEIRCQEIVLNDPRCPEDVRALRPKALSNTYIGFANLAFHQDEFALGYQCLRDAIALVPSLADGTPAPILAELAGRTGPTDTRNLEPMWRAAFGGLPADLERLRSHEAWLIAVSLVAHGTRALMWGELAAGKVLLDRARALGAEIDDNLSWALRYQLTLLDREFGGAVARRVRASWLTHLQEYANHDRLRHMLDDYLVDQAFDRFNAGDHARVPSTALRAIRENPRHVLNRGLLSILFRSMVGQFGRASSW